MEVYFFLGKADRQVWIEAGWRRRRFHAMQGQECLDDPVQATYINIYMESEVYSSVHGVAVVKRVSLNPNYSLSNSNWCGLEECGSPLRVGCT